jgi:fibrillarin-like pre-rRNA processing protein
LEKTIEPIFQGVFKIHNDSKILVTENLTPGITFYGEFLHHKNEKEYRSWNPTRSKLSAAILNGLNYFPIHKGCKILYLGVASGTTCSHISDIIGVNGHIWAIEFSPRSIRDFLDKVVRYRNNLSPLLKDARLPQTYQNLVPIVDVIYSDVAQPEQAKIVIKNAKYFLKKSGWIMLSIKSRSIDVKKKPERIYQEQLNILENEGIKIQELIKLEPYEKDHALATGFVE